MANVPDTTIGKDGPAEVAPSLSWPQILLRILLVLSVFESNRSNMVLSPILARFKDIDIVFFFGTMLAADGWRLDKNFFRRNAYGWLLVYIIFSFPISFYSGQTHYGEVVQIQSSFAWALYLRMLYFCLLMYFLPRYFVRYPEDANKLASLFVAVSVIFVLFNITAYFYHFPFMSVFRPQLGRISNGYPTSDALMLAFALIALFLFTPRMRPRHMLLAVVLILGLIGNLTASGVICLACIGLLYAILNIAKRPVFVVSLLLGVLAVIGIAGYIAYQLILIYSPLDLNTTLSLIAFKFETSVAGTGTFAVRIQEYADALKFMENSFDRLFGLGTYYGLIEIQYAHVFLTWGLVGFLLFGLTLYENLALTIAENRWLSFYYSLVWLIAGAVLVTTYLFPLFMPFALLVAMGSTVAFPRSIDLADNRGR